VMEKFEKRLEDYLKVRKEENSLRELRVNSGLIDFVSNDYLGLARSFELHQNILEQLSRSNSVLNGATGSRLLSGNTTEYEETERLLSTIFKSEKSLIFNSGYAANLSVLSSLPKKGDTII